MTGKLLLPFALTKIILIPQIFFFGESQKDTDSQKERKKSHFGSSAKAPRYCCIMPPQQPALQRLISDTGVPFEYKCPITAEIMEDPVVIADGKTYERAAIEQWLQDKDTSPSTGAELPHTIVVPNQALKIIIRGWEEEEHKKCMAMAAAQAAPPPPLRQTTSTLVAQRDDLNDQIEQRKKAKLAMAQGASSSTSAAADTDSKVRTRRSSRR